VSVLGSMSSATAELSRRPPRGVGSGDVRAQAAQTPDAVALVATAGDDLPQLDEASPVGAAVDGYGGPGQSVALLFMRSAEAIVSIWRC